MRRGVGHRDRSIGIEIRRTKEKLGVGGMGQMGNRGGHDVAPPGVLDVHRNTTTHRQITNGLGFGQPADLGDFEVDDVRRAVVE